LHAGVRACQIILSSVYHEHFPRHAILSSVYRRGQRHLFWCAGVFFLAATPDVYARTLMLLLPQPPPLGLLAACSSLGLPHGRRTTSVPGRRPPRRCCYVFLLFSPVGTVLIGIAASSTSTR
jgi:hypothetical protein